MPQSREVLEGKRRGIALAVAYLREGQFRISALHGVKSVNEWPEKDLIAWKVFHNSADDIEELSSLPEPAPAALAGQGSEELVERIAAHVDDWRKWYDEKFAFLQEIPDSWSAEVMRLMVPRIAASIRETFAASSPVSAKTDAEKEPR
jgi:hypothetical protein